MAKKKLTKEEKKNFSVKVAKIYLDPRKYDKATDTFAEMTIEECRNMNSILWNIQRYVRTLKNRTIQYCWEWNGFSSDYNKQHGSYPDAQEQFGYKTITSHVYNMEKAENIMNTANFSSVIRSASKKFDNDKMEMMKGLKSIVQYKSNQPIELHKDSVRLYYQNKKFYFCLSILNKNSAAELNTDMTFRFEAVVRDKSTRTILERLQDEIYPMLNGSALQYDQHKNKWYLSLCFGVEKKDGQALDPDKILGINLGVAYPIVASVAGDWKRLIIEGGEIEHFRAATEVRKISMLRQRKYCGDGSIGHGVQTRNKPVYKMEDKVARFRDTCNHKYSRAVVDYAVRNGCGTIQMEDLSGITAEAEPFMKNWSYYDLQLKIEYKAKAYGIKVVYINPAYTSCRCSRCGAIHKESLDRINRRFECVEDGCGFKTFQDYNASQNIAFRDIDKVIEKEIPAEYEEDYKKICKKIKPKAAKSKKKEDETSEMTAEE